MADPVWLMVMFDLPTLSSVQRREANRYRNFLLDHAFERVQLSVYARHVFNASIAIPTIEMLKATVPDEGYVRILQISDRQWAGGWRLYGAKYQEMEEPPDQLLLF